MPDSEDAIYLTTKMQAMAIREFGGPDVLQPVERDLPQPSPHEVLIKLAAAGVNRPDLLQRAGHYPVPANASDLPGLEASGVIVKMGEGIGGEGIAHNTDLNPFNLRLGDRVVALCNGGAYAEYCTVPIGQVLPHPPQLSMIEAAALAETIFTVWYNVFMRGGLRAGENFLIHGAASGIGTTAIQIAKAMGARVFATARAGKKLDLCRKLGSDWVIDRDSEDFVEICRQHTDNKGIDVILDMVGGDYTLRNLEVLARDGRLVQIAFLRGNKTDFDLNLVMRKRLTVTGSTLRPQTNTEKATIAKQVYDNVWPMIAHGQFRPMIDRVLDLPQAAAAHHALESGEIAGKIVLCIDATL